MSKIYLSEALEKINEFEYVVEVVINGKKYDVTLNVTNIDSNNSDDVVDDSFIFDAAKAVGEAIYKQ